MSLEDQTSVDRGDGSLGANKFRRHMQMAPMLSNFAQRTLEQEQLWNGIYHPEGERTNDASFSP